MNILQAIQNKFTSPYRGAKIILTKNYNGAYAGAHGYLLKVHKDKAEAKINIDGRMYHTYLRPNEFFLEFPELRQRLPWKTNAAKQNRKGVTNIMDRLPNWVSTIVWIFILIIFYDVVVNINSIAWFFASLILHK